MRRIALLVVGCLALLIVYLAPSAASAATFTQCPAIDLDTGCQFLVNVTDAGTTIGSDPAQGPYEGSDDALIGIVNNSSKPISSVTLSAEDELFGFDGDGICTITEKTAPGCVVLPTNAEGKATLKPLAKCPPEVESCGFTPPAGEPAGITFPAGIAIVGFGANGDPVTGYEGPTSWFTGITSLGEFATGKGTVNFSPAIQPGASSYFSLESPPAGGFGASTTVSTNLTGGGLIGPSISVVQGTAVTDSSTIGGPNASEATGTVSYSVYGDAGCTQLAASAGSASVSAGNGGASVALAGLAPGKYYWQASYSGDVNNHAATSPCGSEVLTVLAPTTTTTAQSGGGLKGTAITVPVGTPVTDTAHIAGALAAASTGTVSYSLYKDSKCTVAAAPASAAAETKGVAGPSGAVKPAAGTYYWKASYSGDAANAPSVSACGGEVLIVAKKANFGLAALGKKCVSKRRFIAHPRAPKGVKLLKVQVFINGKLKATGKIKKGATTINLRGLPKGTFKVAMIATTASGQTYEDVRTFHTCVPKKHRKK
jgi:hypothetical protein